MLKTKILPPLITHELLRDVYRRIENTSEGYICIAIDTACRAGQRSPQREVFGDILKAEDVGRLGDGFTYRNLPPNLHPTTSLEGDLHFPATARLHFLQLLLHLPESDDVYN